MATDIHKDKLVIRNGADWKWEDQDGGAGNVGVVVSSKKKTVKVKWTKGAVNMYRTGAEGKFDLCTVDSSKGIDHGGVTCDSCDSEGVDARIRGIRWKCGPCADYDLCTRCYMTGKHDMNHPFRRFDTRYSMGAFMSSRGNTTNIVTLSGTDLPYSVVFLDHLERLGSPSILHVVRGPDWSWRNQDTGEGTVGVVKTRCEDRTGMLAAAWLPSKEEKNTYRAGGNGIIDLRVIDARQIGSVHMEHTCSCCGEQAIKGTRWRCSKCPSVHLCSNCYHGDKHDLDHSFHQHSSQIYSGVKVPPRSKSWTVTFRSKPSWITAEKYYVEHLPLPKMDGKYLVFASRVAKKIRSRHKVRLPKDSAAEISASDGKMFLGPHVVLNTTKDVLGRGQFGTVYKGYCRTTKRVVAVKEIKVPTGRQKDMAKAEIKYLQSFQHHENLVSLMKYGFFSEAFWVVMEYCNMGDLEEYFKKYNPDRPTQILFMMQLANAVEFMHEMSPPMIHRDLKPANILINFEDTERPVIKVADFGLSKVTHGESGSRTAALTNTSISGTPYYMAPETWEGGGQITPAVDIFAMGLLFNGCLEAERSGWTLYINMFEHEKNIITPYFGQSLLIPRPLQQSNPLQQTPGIQKRASDSEKVTELKDLIIRMVHRDRNERPKATEISEKMKALFADNHQDLPPPPPKRIQSIPELPAYTAPTGEGTRDNASGSESSSDDDEASGMDPESLQIQTALRESLRQSISEAEGIPDIGDDRLDELMRGITQSDSQTGGFNVGDVVQVDADLERVKALQIGHGGFYDNMIVYLGEQGMVKEKTFHVYKVLFTDGRMLSFNPACLTRVEGALAVLREGVTPREKENLKKFKRYDVVEVTVDSSTLDRLQKGHGGCTEGMKEACGIKGLVNGVGYEGDVSVSCINGGIWSFNPEALSKVAPSSDPLVAGDLVVVLDDKKRVKELQKGYGEWFTTMEESLGKTGIITTINENDSASVKFADHEWTFNVKVLKLVAKSDEQLRVAIKKQAPGLFASIFP